MKNVKAKDKFRKFLGVQIEDVVRLGKLLQRRMAFCLTTMPKDDTRLIVSWMTGDSASVFLCLHLWTLCVLVLDSMHTGDGAPLCHACCKPRKEKYA
jgi:hypothetical protein